MKELKLLSGDFEKTIQVKQSSNLLTAIQQSGLFIDAPCGGNGKCRKCTVFIDGKPCLACKTKIEDDINVTIPVYTDIDLQDEKARPHIENISIKPPVEVLKGSNNFGLAIDLGTTTIAIVLIDLNNGNIVDSITFYNPQIIYGADIIHRIVFAQKDNGAQLLKKRVVDEIDMAVNDLCIKHGLASDQIRAVVISGNTTMTHLALGLPTKSIRETPFLPGSQQIKVLDASSLLNTIKKGKIFMMPWIANYLGGDLVSGVSSCELHKKDGINILLDIGTNGEIIVGNNEWLMGCACSAGPAFEGMGLNCGMRYKQGAITGVTYSNGKFEYSVAGNSKPCGISGTGVISLLKHLREQNYIDKRGKFTDKTADKIGARRAFILFEAGQTLNNEAIYVDETDIDNILRAKAAIYSGISLIMKKIDIKFSDISNLYIAGGIGNALNIDDVLDIGLLPLALDKNKISFIGNSSLSGAVKYLLSEEARSGIPEISKKITYIDLSNEPKYMDEYMAALFIPHTDNF